MRKGRDGEKKKKRKKKREKKREKRRMKILATTSLPAVDRPNADRWNAARSRQKLHLTGSDLTLGHPLGTALTPIRRPPVMFQDNDHRQ